MELLKLCSVEFFAVLSNALITNNDKDVSLLMKGKSCRGCVQSCRLRGSETWLVKKKNERTVQRAEKRMIRWMYGV